MGLWPGCARFADGGRGGSFSFVVLNDTHFHTPQCGPWFDRVAGSIKALAQKPDFCLVVGDLAETGTPEQLGGMRDALRSFGLPYHTVIGNHDHASDTDRRPYETLFPRSINYHFEHRGWRFVGLDSSEGTKWRQTSIQEPTLKWVDDAMRRLDPSQPTVLFTHFPLGAGVTNRPRNADDLLSRFEAFNISAVFNGHYHAFTERPFGGAIVSTNRCCAISRGNHDGTKERGYFLCHAREGIIRREFVEVTAA